MSGGIAGGNADWIVPHLNTIPRPVKPPLVYWAAGGLFKVFGATEWAGRLAPALAAVFVMFLLYIWGRQAFDQTTGVGASLIWATALLPAALGRTLNTDMLLCAGMTTAFWGLWLAGSQENHRMANGWWPYIVTGIGLGMAMLAKGPIGVALPLLVGAAYLTLCWNWRAINWRGVVLGLVLATALSLPWYGVMELHWPGFWNVFFVQQNLERFADSQEYHSKQPFWYYLPVILLGMMPWTAFLLPGLANLKNLRHPAQRPVLYLVVWIVVVVLFLSKSNTKLVSYILPVFPAVALLTAHGMSQIGAQKKWLVVVTTVVLGITYCSLAAGATVYLTNDKTLPKEVGWPFAAVIIPIAMIGFGAVAFFWLRREGRKALLIQFAVASMLLTVLLILAGRIAIYEDASPMLRALSRQTRPGETVLQVDVFQPSAIFYLRRPIQILNFNNTSWLDAKAIARSPWFLQGDGSDLTPYFQQSRRVFVLLSRKRRDGNPLPGKAFLWARNNDFLLFSNRPAPKNFSFDFVAPAKKVR